LISPIHAVVVGGTKGLGRVVAQRFLDRGCVVTVISRNPPMDHLLSERVSHVPCDLESLTNAAEVADRVRAASGAVNYVVFCQRYRGAGDPWSGELQVSLTATKHLVLALQPLFATAGDRAVAVVSSVYARFVGGSQPVSYHVAKAGLNQLVRYYAWSMGKDGIRVNAVMPLTYMKDESREHYLSNAPLLDLYRRCVPLARMGTTDDSANLIDFLCSDKSAFITGQEIYVDGGLSVVWPEELARGLTSL
jgi:NAD(P)-dependent dehydrogenase (short-subunit alcohol dehydrogenase family)